MMLRLGFSMWWCMVSFSGSIIWVFPMGILVRLGLRYRLLWFWVFGWVFPRVLPMGLG